MRCSLVFRSSRVTSMDLKGIAGYMKSGTCKSVVVLTGAEIFTAWRGLYQSLRPHLITATDGQREALRRSSSNLMSRDLFLANQFPYLEVRRPFILGTQEAHWKPTLTHWFSKFLEEENLLTRVFSLNVDGLGRQTGISPERLCDVHGSMAEAACEACGAEADFDTFCADVRAKIKDVYDLDPDAPEDSSNIYCSECGAPAVKPRTVLFGGALPSRFKSNARHDLPGVSLLVVAGSSLVAAPANRLVQMVPNDCVRLVVSREPVGAELGIEYGPGAKRDIFAGARSCDETILELMQLMGWEDKVSAVQHQLPVETLALLGHP